jgi:4-hydroxy-tetrahydrodipicolinate synthase
MSDPGEVMISASAMARQAAKSGADAILVHPPAQLREHPDRDTLMLDYHRAIAEAGLPLVLFYLYEQAGGIAYGTDLLGRLLAMPQVVGIKIATLDSVMTFQDIAHQMSVSAPDKMVITGEDRFLGYSLMCGAKAALIGMGAACTALQCDLIRSYRQGDWARFFGLNTAVDELARWTFCAPMEGYIQRMLWCLVHQGVIPIAAAHDPWGPVLDPAEFAALGDALKRIERELPAAEEPTS